MSIFDITLTIINAGLSAYLIVYFFDIFGIPIVGKKVKYLLELGICAVFISIMIFVHVPFLKMLSIISLCFASTLMYKMKWYNRLILSLLNYTISGAAEYLVLAFVSVIFSLNISECYSGGFLVLGIFLSKVFIFLIELIIKLSKHKLFSGQDSKRYCLIILLPISNIAVILLQYRFYYSGSMTSTRLSWIDLLCNTLLIVTNIIAFKIIDIIRANAEYDAKLSLINRILISQEEQYKELHSHHQSILKIKHDEKNHLLGILANLENERYADIRKSIKSELEIIDTQVSPIGNNSIISLIVNHKCDLAAKHGINIVCETVEIPKIKISAIDLAIILGNALDNAIEATAKADVSTKNIHLIVKVRGEQIVMIIKNPVKSGININALQSQKESIYHGFGILSMRSIANTYNGEVIFTAENGIFQTHIVLSNSTI